MATTARERARQRVLADIDAEARRQLARDGAATLSLRSIARELGMVSSGIYRYVASRDDLLTRLIIQAYDDLATAVEKAVRTGSPRACWVAAGTAVRTWAHRHPHEYALLYGSPVPGYAAPQDTVGPAIRVYAAMAEALRVWMGGSSAGPSGALAELGLEATDDEVPEILAAFMQVFGMVSFELFGHTKGVVDDHEAFFIGRLEALADGLGLGS